MSIQALIEKIARTAMVVDAADPDAVHALRHQFEELHQHCPADPESALRRFTEDAVRLLSQVTEENEAGDSTSFDELLSQIAEIQSILDSASRTPTPVSGSESDDAEVDVDPAAEAAAIEETVEDPLDQELLAAWIASCESGLTDLEGTLLKIESDPPCVEELAADAARCIHTLKGECGVLSLHDAQSVLHETESLISRCRDEGAAFPVDETLAVVDWLQGFVERLSSDPTASADGWEELLQRLQAFEIPAGEDTTEQPAEPEATAIDDSPEAEAVEDINESNVADDAPAPVEELSDDDAAAILAALEAEHAESAGATAEPTSNDAPDATGSPATMDADPASTGELVTFPNDLGMDENLNDFLCEAREHLQNAEESLLALEDDPTDMDLIAAVFRAFHTIKGVAGFMNLVPIVDLAHEAETLLDKVRESQLDLNTDRLNLILKSCDQLERLIAVLEGATAPTLAEQNALIRAITASIHGESVSIQVEETATEDVEIDGPSADVEPEEPAGEEESPVAETDDEVTIESAAASPTPTPQAVTEVKANARRSTRMDQTVKVSTRRMDSLVTMVGELVIAHQMVAQDPSILGNQDQRFQRNMTQVGKIIRDLQEVSMALRMVTLKGTFQKMARIVRDVASKADKRIQFVMEGEDVELDRNVVEEIADPLVHMVRNSCDHGIEPENDRIAAGKPVQGVLTLRAYHQGGRIIIEVEDDGRGLNRERILAKAVERGIVSSEREAHEMADADVWNLIFQPGFSTAETVTDLSGRGVGMDVVRRNIEALRGSVSVDSRPGRGTTMRISLPLTMAIIDGMVVKVGEQRFVLPTLNIEQSFQPTEGQVKTCQHDGEMVNIRGTMLPVHRLKDVFDLEEGETSLTDALLIVLESATGRFCLVVDDILGQQQVVIKSLGGGLTPINGVSGGAILGDGRVALILDIGGVFQQATESQLAA